MSNIYLHLNIKELRKKKRLTQEELSDILEVKKATISTYERGVSNPSFDVLLKIRALFEVSLDDLIYTNLLSPNKESQVQELHPDTTYIIDLLKKRILQLEAVIKTNLPGKVGELNIT